GAGHDRRTAVPRAGEVDGRKAVPADEPVDVRVDQAQARAGPPVPEETRLDVLGPEWLPEQRILLKVDLPDGEGVRRAPPGVDHAQLLRVERIGHGDAPFRRLAPALVPAPRPDGRACRSGVASVRHRGRAAGCLASWGRGVHTREEREAT